MDMQKAFNLIELIIVIVLLSIVVAISLPKFINFSSKAKENADIRTTAGALQIAVNLARNFCLSKNLYNLSGDYNNDGSDDIHFNSNCFPNGGLNLAESSVQEVTNSGISDTEGNATCLNLAKLLLSNNFDGIANLGSRWDACSEDIRWCVRRTDNNANCQYRYWKSGNYESVLYNFNTGLVTNGLD